MNVIGFRANPSAGAGDADSVHSLATLGDYLPQADFVALTCPLTPETKHAIDAAALGRMKKSAYLVNTARGGCVDEAALIAALRTGAIAGAALDCTDPEPPAAESPLWAMPNVLITPHTGGETTQYEKNVNNILLENLDRLWRKEDDLRNGIL